MQFQSVLSNQHHPEAGVVTVPFPFPRAEYDNTIALLEPLEIGDALKRDCHVNEMRGDYPILKRLDNQSASTSWTISPSGWTASTIMRKRSFRAWRPGWSSTAWTSSST